MFFADIKRKNSVNLHADRAYVLIITKRGF